jgi:transcriptional regulator
MYIPAANRVEEKETLHDLIRQYSFGTLVTSHEGAPFATHLPFLLDADSGPHGTLRAHLARANPQWQQFREGQEALAIFQGPHAYISPAWYETHPSVPTWNYAVVHAYGVPRLLDDAELYRTLQDTVAQYESPREAPWEFASLTDEYVQKMMRGIVGVEIPIARLEGKYKLSQNRPQSEQERVIAALIETADPLGVETAAWMRQYPRSTD